MIYICSHCGHFYEFDCLRKSTYGKREIHRDKRCLYLHPYMSANGVPPSLEIPLPETTEIYTKNTEDPVKS